MGLTEASKVKFINVSLGKLRIRCDENNPKAVKRIIEKTGEPVYELVYNSLKGIVTKILFKEHEKYGRSIAVTVKDNDEDYVVNISESSKYFTCFASLFPKTVLGSPIVISPYKMARADGKFTLGLTIKQDGEKIVNPYKSWDGKKYVYKGKMKELFKAKMDIDDWKIANMQFTKYLREELSKIADSLYSEDKTTSVSKDDLPF